MEQRKVSEIASRDKKTNSFYNGSTEIKVNSSSSILELCPPLLRFLNHT
jgi:hypothetical protein